MRSTLVCVTLFALAFVAFAHPQDDDAAYVAVPGGRSVHKDCVYEVESGSKVIENKDGTVSLISPLGLETQRIPARCPYPVKYSSSAITKLNDNDDVEAKISQSGYTLDANHYFECKGCPAGKVNVSNVEIGFFTGFWKVPTAPTSAAGQIIYLWNGIVAATGGDVLQPVLQFGTTPAGGGNFWGLASWYVGGLGTVHTKVVKVSAGDTINGTMSIVDSNKTWRINGTDLDSGVNATLDLSLLKYGEQFGIYVTLEVYSVTACSQLPATTCDFTQLSAIDVAGAPMTPDWAPQVFYKDQCGENVMINSPTNITLVWKA